MDFDNRAVTWDSSVFRQQLADAVAKSIRKYVSLSRSMQLLDVGAGTGLLTRRLLPHVEKITGIDSSAGMLQKFSTINGDIEAVQANILEYTPNKRFDGIVSSMTMHHIENSAALFKKLHTLLKPGGFIALADLAPEDGTFHEDGNEGVFHFGFDSDTLIPLAEDAGFICATYRIIYTFAKGGKEYKIFLLVAKRDL